MSETIKSQTIKFRSPSPLPRIKDYPASPHGSMTPPRTPPKKKRSFNL